ncbi:MAG: FHA domain-containing protein [Lentisphaeraceae bacterium]|nr:FHA domain-containing protein [Lentisphaeraceae bacterium]
MSTPRAIILSEIMRGKSFDLDKEVYNIGRTEENDICIPDGTLSSNHCTLTKEGKTFKVVDHGSTNGTRINGERISESYLRSSDILQVGGIEILFDSDDQAEKASNTTQTNINLDMDADLGGIKNMQNINPIKTSHVTKQEGKGKGFMIVIGVLVLVVAVLLYFVIMKVMGK